MYNLSFIILDQSLLSSLYFKHKKPLRDRIMLDTELGRAILYLMQSQGLLSVNCTSYQLKKIMSTFFVADKYINYQKEGNLDLV